MAGGTAGGAAGGTGGGAAGGSSGPDFEWSLWPVPPDITSDGGYLITTAGVVTDSVTGLEWQRSLSTSTYTLADARSYCAGLSLDGGGWRVPTLIELETTVNFGTYSPAIDRVTFPGTPPDELWTASAAAADPTRAWEVNFYYGMTGTRPVTDTYQVRCVRSPTPGSGITAPAGAPAGRYTLTSTTAFDTETGLTWQRSASSTGLTWAAADSSCQGLTLGGHTGWRLPTEKELETLVDVRASSPAIDSTVFPGTASNYYWASSTGVLNYTTAWVVNFRFGNAYASFKTSTIPFVRCVR